MLKYIAACGAAIVLVCACGVQSSSLDANASVTVSGKALGPDGHPLASTKVVLLKELDLGEVVGGLFLTAASLGIACLADHPPAICANNSHATTTDGGGAYSFSIKGRDTQGSFGVASTMEVVTRAPARTGEVGGPVAFEEFNVQAPSLSLPDLHIWQPLVTPAGPSASQHSSWPLLPSSFGSSPTYTLEFSDLHGNPWWVTGPTSPGKWVDGRVLEDLNGAFDVNARARGTASGTTVEFTYVSGSVAVHGSAGPPPSRGAQCGPFTNAGVGAFGACTLTSGNPGPHTFSSAGANGVVIDLGRNAPISLVVARGCTGQCAFAVSSDLSTWSDAGAVSGLYATAPIATPSAVGYLRITGSFADLRQVSIW